MGDRIELKSNNNYVFCIVEISRIIGESPASKDTEIESQAKPKRVALIIGIIILAIAMTIGGIFLYKDRWYNIVVTDGEKELYPWNEYILVITGSDFQDVKWESSDNSVAEVTADSNDVRRASLEVKRCGFVTISAEVDGQTISYDPCIRIEENFIEIESDRVEVDGDEQSFWVAYSFSNTEDQLCVSCEDGSMTEVEFTDIYQGDAMKILIKRKKSGTSTMRFYAADADDNIDPDVEPKYLTVVCE